MSLTQKPILYLKNNSSTFRKFVSDSGVLLLSAVVVNGFNYLFHLGSARLLSIENFGILQTLLNYLNLLTIFTVIIRLQVTKELALLIEKGKNAEASSFVVSVNKFILKLGFFVFFPFILLWNIFYKSVTFPVLHLFILLCLAILTLMIVTYRSHMRAHLKFFSLGLNTSLQSFLKLVIVIPLLYFGLKLDGAMFGLLAVYLLTFWFTLKQLSKHFSSKNRKSHKINLKTFSKESLITLIGYLGLTSFVSLDLILVQKLMPSEAGFYAALLLFGKVILFLTTPISNVIFPSLSSKKVNQSNKFLVYIAIGSVSLICLGVLLVYMLIPEFLIGILLSQSYLPISTLLFPYSLFMFVYSLCYVLVNSYIAKSIYYPSYISFIGATTQAIGIILYHESLAQVVHVSLFTASATLFCLIVYQSTRGKLHTP